MSLELLRILGATALLAGIGLLMVKLAVEKRMLEWKRRGCPRCGRPLQLCRAR